MATTNILILGAGAVGAFYGSRLALAPHTSVSVICRSNYPTVKSSGFKITSPQYPATTFHPTHVFSSPSAATASALGKNWHYIIVATKALPDVSDDSALLADLVGPDTAIVILQNGLGVEEPYARRFPNAVVLSAVTIVSAAQPRHGVIQHNRWTRISIGPYISTDASQEGNSSSSSNSNSKKNLANATTATETLVSLLQKGGIKDAIPHDPTHLQLLRWHKLAINAAMNPTSVLSGGPPNSSMASDPELSLHLLGVMHEVSHAARLVCGRPFPPDFATPEQVLASTRKNGSGSRPSMWADWTQGAKMELEVILGEAVRRARGVGVEMPRCQGMWAMLRVKQGIRDEERRRGEEGGGKL